MAKKQIAAPVFAAITAIGFEILAGNVAKTQTGFSVQVRPSRKKYLEHTEIQERDVLTAVTGVDGYVVFRHNAASVATVELLLDTAERTEFGTLYQLGGDESNESVFIADATSVIFTKQVDDEEEETPAKKGKAAPAKKGKKVVEEEEDEEEEDDEDEDEDEEEEEAPKKSKGKAAPAKKGKKVVEEDDEDEDEDEEEEEEEEEAPKKSKKSTKAAPAKKGKKVVEEDDEDEDEDEDEDDEELDF